MKAYMRVVGGGGDTLPRDRKPDDHPTPLPQANIDYVPRDMIWEIVSTTLLPRLQCPPYHWAKEDTLTQATLSHQAKVYTLTYAAAIQLRGTL